MKLMPARQGWQSLFMEEIKMEEKLICSHCGAEITDDDYSMVNGQIVCSDCVERYCCTCDRCGATIFDSDAFGDEYTSLCESCYDNFHNGYKNYRNMIHKDSYIRHRRHQSQR